MPATPLHNRYRADVEGDNIRVHTTRARAGVTHANPVFNNEGYMVTSDLLFSVRADDSGDPIPPFALLLPRPLCTAIVQALLREDPLALQALIGTLAEHEHNSGR